MIVNKDPSEKKPCFVGSEGKPTQFKLKSGSRVTEEERDRTQQ